MTKEIKTVKSSGKQCSKRTCEQGNVSKDPDKMNDTFSTFTVCLDFKINFFKDFFLHKHFWLKKTTKMSSVFGFLQITLPFCQKHQHWPSWRLVLSSFCSCVLYAVSLKSSFSRTVHAGEKKLSVTTLQSCILCNRIWINSSTTGDYSPTCT